MQRMGSPVRLPTHQLLSVLLEGVQDDDGLLDAIHVKVVHLFHLEVERRGDTGAGRIGRDAWAQQGRVSQREDATRRELKLLPLASGGRWLRAVQAWCGNGDVHSGRRLDNRAEERAPCAASCACSCLMCCFSGLYPSV